MNHFVYRTKEEFHKYHNIVFVLFVFCMMVVISFFATRDMNTSSAANLNNFNPANIISDAVMGNYNAMTVADIQNFLNSKNSCNNRDYNLYLQYKAAHPSINWHWEGEPYNGHFVCLAEERFGDGEVIGSGMTAAEIIYDAAQKNKINPQVLLVLLQKESSLITDKVPNSHDYRQATGYGCPDTAACDSKYYGFKNQVYRAAELFRYTLDNGYSLYPVGVNVYVGYHPNSSCGGSTIKIENRATAALYRYTPYQPNQAALNAGYGVGNTCSAYGNRNFYLYFTDWFGSTQAAVQGELTTIVDGEYTIASAITDNLALGTNNTNVETVVLNTSDESQRWKIQRDAQTGYYQITNVQNGQVLITQSTEVTQNTNIRIGVSTTCSKWWKIYRTSDDYLTFESACTSGMAMDVKNGLSLAGTNIEAYIADNSKAQKWKLIAGQTLSDGVYTISSSSNDAKMIDIEGGWSKNGTNVQIYDANNAGAQKWRVEYNSQKHAYTFTNPDTNKRLDLAGAATKNRTNINLWQSVDACSQYWQIVPTDDGYYTILSTCASDKALDLVGGATKNATNIQLWDVNNAKAQKWQFNNQKVLPEGNYEIVSKNDPTYAIDIEGGWNRNAVNVNLYEANGATDAQLWRVRYNSKTGDYTLLNQSGNRSLDLEGGWTKLDTNIQIYDNNSACAQRWTMVKNSDNTYTFISTCQHDRAIDLNGGKTYNTNNIRLWALDDSNAQKWQFNLKTN